MRFMMSHIASNLKFNSLFKVTSKKTPKPQITGSLWWEVIGDTVYSVQVMTFEATW